MFSYLKPGLEGGTSRMMARVVERAWIDSQRKALVKSVPAARGNSIVHCVWVSRRIILS